MYRTLCLSSPSNIFVLSVLHGFVYKIKKRGREREGGGVVEKTETDIERDTNRKVEERDGQTEKRR